MANRDGGIDVLHVDDDEDFAELAATFLRREGRDRGDIVCDRGRLQQVFENLFRNAREHAGEGATVRVGRTEFGFYVEDDGPGIPAEERGQVFESRYTTAEGGTGFGLAIVRRITEAHGWSVEVREGRDGGARFEVGGVQSLEEAR